MVQIVGKTPSKPYFSRVVVGNPVDSTIHAQDQLILLIQLILLGHLGSN